MTHLSVRLKVLSITTKLPPTTMRLPESTLVKSIFLLLGIGLLVPWNAFISAKPYFQARLCSHNVEFYLSVFYNLASVITLAILLFCQHQRDQTTTIQQQPESLSSNTHDQASWNKDHSFWLVVSVLPHTTSLSSIPPP